MREGDCDRYTAGVSGNQMEREYENNDHCNAVRFRGMRES